MGWSRMDLPAGVFANKLNSGEFTLADFDVASLNDPSALNHLGTNLSLEVPIDVFGKVGTMATAMAAYGDAASAGTRDATQEIRMRVVEAYRQAEMAGRAVEVTERVLGVAKAREAEIEARVDTGGALQADLLRARARRREREADLAERRSQRRMAQAGLARLLGAPSGVDYVPTEGPPAVAPLEGDEAAWVERALRQRPVLEAARRKTDAASAFAEEREERPPARRRRLRPALGQPDPGRRREAVVGGGGRPEVVAVRPRPQQAARPRPPPTSARPRSTSGRRPTRCAWRWRWPTAGRCPPASATPPRPAGPRRDARPSGWSRSAARPGWRR